MDAFIARLNIQHFRKLLGEEADKAKRENLLRLLLEEERILSEIENGNPGLKAKGTF
jgi:hypothetical protein